MPSPGSPDDHLGYLDILADNEVDSLAFVCGNLNGDVGYLGGGGGGGGGQDRTDNGKCISIFFEEFSLLPANLMEGTTGPINTFRGGMGSTTIDYIAVPISLKHLIVSCQVIDENILNHSDHLSYVDVC